MQTWIAGQKSNISDLFQGEILQIKVDLKIAGSEIDVSCFGVDEKNVLSDDRYFVFYNQLSSPKGEIRKDTSKNQFQINLDALPSSIAKVVLTAAIDGNAAMSDLKQGKVSFLEGTEEKASYIFHGTEFQKEKAIILAEFYQYKGKWKIAVVGKGFHGGLSALLAHFGGVEEKTPIPEPIFIQPTLQTAPVSLTKKEKVQKTVLEKAPYLVDLTKKAIVSLEKKNLMEVVAQVVLVLDESGSIIDQYEKGRIQRILDKVLPLALLFDDDGILESWAFASSSMQLENITISNIQNYIKTANGGWQKWNIGYTNNEPEVMEALYHKHKKSKIPVYIIFISDGGVYKAKRIRDIIIKASRAPLFWQFIGIHGQSYGILEDFDTMKGRFIDNANFFALDDIDSISDEALYDRLMNEFPLWIKEAKRKHILP